MLKCYINLPSLSVANSCSVGVIEPRIFVSKIITMTSVWTVSCMHPLLLKKQKLKLALEIMLKRFIGVCHNIYMV